MFVTIDKNKWQKTSYLSSAIFDKGTRSMQQRGQFSWMNILLIFIFMLGLGILLYPNISDYINQKNSSKAVSEYDDSVAQMNHEQRVAVMESANSYNSKLSKSMSRFTDMTEDEYEEYMNELNINGEGMMCYLKIDKLGVNLPVYHGTDESVLQHYIGHVEGTSLPVGGIGTHCGLSGHRGLPTAVLFTNLDRMEVGDTFEIYILGEVHQYVVDQIVFVLPDDLSPLEIDPNEDYVTLITCHPYGVNTHRMMVRGKRVPEGENAEDIVEAESGDNKKKLFDFTREQAVNMIAIAMTGGFFFIGIPLFILVPVRKRILVLRPWDDNIVEVIDAAVIVSAYATRANWEVSEVAKEADWLASLRRWDEDMGSVKAEPRIPIGPQDDLDVIDELDRIESEEFVLDLMKLDGVPEDVDVYDLLKQLKQEDEEQETKEQEAEVIDPEAGENIIEENTIEEVVESDTADDIELMLDMENKKYSDLEEALGDQNENASQDNMEQDLQADTDDDNLLEEEKINPTKGRDLSEDEKEVYDAITEKVNGKELRDETLLYDKLLMTGVYEERPWNNYEYEEDSFTDEMLERFTEEQLLQKEEEENREEYIWDNEILEKVDQDWSKLDPRVQKVALPFIDIKKVLEDKRNEQADSEDKKE